jgi:hypothetical protein
MNGARQGRERVKRSALAIVTFSEPPDEGMPRIPDRAYAEIVKDLGDFESYLRCLGVQEFDRLRGVIANIREIEKACSDGRAKALETDPRLRELVWSLVEGAELAEIFRGIQSNNSATLKKLMRRAIAGPLDPKHETANTNIGRNTLFELRLGAGFRRAGASVTLGGAADLSVDHTGFRLYVECKRPLGEHNIARRFEEGCAQLRDRFKSDPHPNLVGMVALSISKALKGEQMLVVDREEDLQPSLSAEAKRAYKSYCGSINTEIDLRIVGTICHVFAPARVRANGRLIAAWQFDVFLRDHLNSVLPVTGDALRNLLSRL